MQCKRVTAAPICFSKSNVHVTKRNLNVKHKHFQSKNLETCFSCANEGLVLCFLGCNLVVHCSSCKLYRRLLVSRFNEWIDYTGCYGFGNKAPTLLNAWKNQANAHDEASSCPNCTEYGCDELCTNINDISTCLNVRTASRAPTLKIQAVPALLKCFPQKFSVIALRSMKKESRVEVNLKYSLSRFFPVKSRNVAAYLHIARPESETEFAYTLSNTKGC